MRNRQKHGLFEKNRGRELRKTEPDCKKPRKIGHSCILIVQILAVACEPPEKSGRPITHWTAHELADEVVKRGIVPSISVAQVGRYLREAALQPHKKRYWLNTTEKDRDFSLNSTVICCIP